MSLAILASSGSYAADVLVAARLSALTRPDLSDAQVGAGCPYGLSPTADGEAVMVVSGWFREIERRSGAAAASSVLAHLRARFSKRVVLDQNDSFQLGISRELADWADVVLKVNGTYRDLDLNNWVAGASSAAGRWTAKTAPLPEGPWPADSLRKLHTCVPCFIGVIPEVRARVRRFYRPGALARVSGAVADRLADLLARRSSAARPPFAIHSRGALTHAQRRVALQMLKAAPLTWRGGLTRVPDVVAGLRGDGLHRLSGGERSDIENDLRREGLWARPLNRLQYRMEMLRCKAVLSVTGYGELCFRMAEAWASRRVLVCQDLSHADVRFPLRNGGNVVYCRPDLSDLVDIVRDIDGHYERYVEIAEQGHRDWLAWAGNWRETVSAAFGPALSTCQPSRSTG
jgi:hypothetical protein